MGRNGGGAIRERRELTGLGAVGDAAGGCDVPVNCCTNDRKSLGSVLYTVGARRGCATVGRNPLRILLDDLFTANDPPLLLPLPNSPPGSPASMESGAAMQSHTPLWQQNQIKSHAQPSSLPGFFTLITVVYDDDTGFFFLLRLAGGS